MKTYFIDRRTQIKHFTDLSILSGRQASNSFEISFSKNEIYALQLAVLSDFDDTLTECACSGNGSYTCINTDGVDKWGKPFHQEVELRKNTIRPLFVMLDYTDTKLQGDTLEIQLITKATAEKITVKITLTEEPVKNNGFDDLWRLSRLIWLNSDRAIDNSIVAPFTAIENDNLTFKILGRRITLGKNGLPIRVESYFDESVELCKDVQCELLKAPVSFKLGETEPEFTVESIENNTNTATVISKSDCTDYSVRVVSQLYYDGYIEYKLILTGKKNYSFDNISLSYSLTEQASKYMNGFSKPGGKIEDMTAAFDKTKHRDCLYTGTINAGMRLKLKAENYIKPLINIYYHNRELIIPEETWDNHSNGILNVKMADGAANIDFSTGKFSLSEGETRTFRLELHITPFKFVDYKKQYKVRYFHNDSLNNKIADEENDLKEAVEKGLNYMIFHHGSRVHPYINYPFIETERLKSITEKASKYNIGTKVYYTVREHSNHMAETFAYKALDNEIIMRKKGDGSSWMENKNAPWMKEYFGEKVIPAWRVSFEGTNYKSDDDETFIVNSNSRLDNYYVEGLNWLVENIGIKGIYIDDTALDRTTLERAKKVLSKCGGLIDMHTWNHHKPVAGDCSCINLYTELVPFLDSMWIGEGFDVTALEPDFILTEVAMLPYGIGSQMLQDGGDIFIGMLYAMNSRYAWMYKNADVEYKLWDDFKIQDSKMLGYWHSKNPVQTNDERVLCTVYRKTDSALVCMYNFSDDDKNLKITLDKTLLGFDYDNVASLPELKGKQAGGSVNVDEVISMPKRSGMIFEIKAY